ncbi:putative LINE-1 type transposase domain-containing protein 1-like [Triplophysa rosa]|uniref:LINE-1 type transposase domain-containing protein 1-like n=1 Tax=Triplophysa rosa TaxID=992332 RepID=A0A9W7TNE8_TRIRA|nr:putative LINE-1 type transposase domain-containing protein 1-like [Triplophysa rosa]
MPSKKGKKEHKSDSSPVKEREDDGDASIMASSSDAVSNPPQSDEIGAHSSQNLDVIQKLELMRTDFATKIKCVLNAIHDVKKDVRDFSGCMDLAEERISSVEDTVNSEKSKLAEMDKRVESLSQKLDDLENRSRRSNLRLVNLPEKVENPDAAAFLEKWLPETLGTAIFPAPPIIERAHRLPGRTQSNRSSLPRVLIMKFLNFQDKVRVMQAARAKGKIMYGDQEVKFFPDLSAELLRQRRHFYGVKQRLRALNITYGLIYPARLRVTMDGQTRMFDNPTDAERFLSGIQQTDET